MSVKSKNPSVVTPSRRAAKDRPPLSRDRALRAAVWLADEGGLAAVTMRAVAAALQVEAMSLYHHVSGKADLLDGMVDVVFAEFTVPVAGSPWRSQMRGRCSSVRRVLGVHGWAVGLLDSRSQPGPATLRHHDAVLGCLRADGFSVSEAGSAIAVLDAFTYGFAVQERSLPVGPGESEGDLAAAIVAAMPAGAYPHLVELATERVMQPGYDFGDEFEVGLALVLDGLAHLPGPSARPPAPS